MRGRGQPPIYTPELGAIICERIAGGESLRKICRDSDMPGIATVVRWIASTKDEHKPFQEAYALACRGRAHIIVDEILDISDDSTQDVDDEGKVNHEHIQRARLRVDSRKWLAGKFLPDQFGDRVNVGGVQDRPVETKEVGRNEIARRIAFALMGRGEQK